MAKPTKEAHAPSSDGVHSSAQEYISMFHGKLASRNKITEGNPMMGHTVDQLMKTETVVGQHMFDFKPEGGVIFDVALWMPDRRPEGTNGHHEIQTETMPGVSGDNADFSSRGASQPLPDQLRLQEVRSLLAREVLRANGKGE